MAPFLTKFALKFGVDGNSSQLPTWCAAVVVAAICVYVAGFVLPLKVIRPILSRRKKDEVRVILKCDLSAWQKAWYTRVTDEGRDILGRKKYNLRIQNMTVQLRKVCNHPYMFLEQHYPEWNENIVRSSGKFELLDRLLPKFHRAGHRVLIFSPMTKCMTVLEDYLRLKGYQFLRIDGSIRGGDRDELIEQFNAPDSPYFIFIQSARYVLDLHTADTVIMFDSDWIPQMKEHIKDHARRDGQAKKVRVFVLVSVGSVEEVILNRAKHTAEERTKILVEIIRKGANALGGEVPSEREINRLAARSDEEFWLFEKMDEERRKRENNGSRLMEEHEVKKINDELGVY